MALDCHVSCHGGRGTQLLASGNIPNLGNFFSALYICQVDFRLPCIQKNGIMVTISDCERCRRKAHCDEYITMLEVISPSHHNQPGCFGTTSFLHIDRIFTLRHCRCCPCVPWTRCSCWVQWTLPSPGCNPLRGRRPPRHIVFLQDYTRLQNESYNIN